MSWWDRIWCTGPNGEKRIHCVIMLRSERHMWFSHMDWKKTGVRRAKRKRR